MADKSSSSNGGLGVVGLLGVLFVALKLMGYIDWSWWLVTFPFYGVFAAALLVLAFHGLCIFISAAIRRW